MAWDVRVYFAAWQQKGQQVAWCASGELIAELILGNIGQERKVRAEMR